MSYINDALRKVQKERENRYTPYHDIISSISFKTSQIGRRHGVLSLPIVAIALLALFMTSMYFMYKREIKPAKGEIPIVTDVVSVRKETTSKTEITVVPEEVIVSESTVQGTALEKREKTGELPQQIEKPDNSAMIANLYEEGLTAQRQKNWGEAEYFYRKVITLEPHHISSLNNLGVIYLSKKRHDEAQLLFEKAIASKGDYVDPYYNLACLNAQKGNTEAAMDFLKKAVQIDNRVKEWAISDPDLTEFRILPEFIRLTAP